MRKTFSSLLGTVATTVLAIAMFTACAKEELGENRPETDQTELFKKLENPYSVANMRKAYAALSPQTRATADFDAEDIVTTHLYVKFMPRTEDEENLLSIDTSLTLYPYPLDYEIAKPSEYVDPSIPEGMPRHYYASVEVGKELPSYVKWEILEELYIPDEYDEDDEPVINTRASYSLDEVFIESLVDEALALTGNEEPRTGGTTRARSSWRPAGYITYYDDVAGKTIGLEGVEVKARRWFTTHKGYANLTTGYYSCDGTFKRDANYSFNFERDDFHVKGDVKTDFDGPKWTGNWDYSFRRSTNQQEYFGATIFRAAYHYCNKPIDGLARPPQSGFLKAKIKLHAKYEDKGSLGGNFEWGRFLWISGKTIEIYNPNDPTDEIYACTIHELAHSAHWRNNKYLYEDADFALKESWTTGISYYLTRKVYPDFFPYTERNGYTGIIIDLMDGIGLEKYCDYYRINKNTRPVGSTRYYTDNVSGYTITQIQNAVFKSRILGQLYTNLWHDYDNDTEDHLEELYIYWSSDY